MSAKDDFADLVAGATGCTKSSAREAVDGIFDSIVKSCKKGDEVQIPGFGKFSVRQRAARMGRNPQTGEQIKIKASKSVGFKPATAFKNAL